MAREATRCHPASVRRRLLGCPGQSTVEWLVLMVGIIALGSVLVRTMPAAADTVYSNFTSIVCKASGRSCPEPSNAGNGGGPQASPPPASNQDPGAPNDGPSIGTGMPVDSIPGMPNGQGWSAKSESPAFTVTVDQTNSPCTIDGSGKASVTLGASVDFNVHADAGVKAKGVTAQVEASLGNKTSYEVQTDPKTADAIERHQRDAPNPADPKSIPLGSSITMGKESYKGKKGAVAYREIQVEMGFKEGRKVSSAVQRIDGTHVRLTVGDSDLVENTVGVSAGPASFKWGQSFDDGKARSVDLDISTAAGRATYGRFIETGHLPQAGDRGASNPATAISTTDTSTGQAAVDFGTFGVSAGGPSVGYQNVETTHADGSKERNVFIRKGDNVMSTHYDLDGAGNIKGQSWALHLQDVKPDFINGLNAHTGRSGRVNGPRDVSLTFGPNDTKALQDAALDQLLASQRGRGGPFGDGGTRAQMLAYLRAHDDGGGLVGTAQAIVPLLGVAGAKTPDDVIRAFLNQSQGSGERLMERLAFFAADTRAARHKLGLDPDAPLPLGLSDRPVGC
jgi:hypothetical protein